MGEYQPQGKKILGSPRPSFKKGQRVLIDKLQLTGRIARVRGYDPFGDNVSYDIKLDSNNNHRLQGRTVAWTEQHLSKVR
jgi:hypothetical protein